MIRALGDKKEVIRMIVGMKKWKEKIVLLKGEPSIKDAALVPKPNNGILRFLEKNRDGPSNWGLQECKRFPLISMGTFSIFLWRKNNE